MPSTVTKYMPETGASKNTVPQPTSLSEPAYDCATRELFSGLPSYTER